MKKEKAPPPSSKSHPGKQKVRGGLRMTKNVLSIVALSIVISLVTIHLKAFRVAAGDSDVVPILDTSRDKVRLGDTDYYILPIRPSMEREFGLTFTAYPKSVSITRKDLGEPVTFYINSPEVFVSESQYMFIKFHPNHKWWVYNTVNQSYVNVSNDASQAGALFTIKQVAGQSPQPDPYYQICFSNLTLGIDKKGYVVVGTGFPLEVVFEKKEKKNKKKKEVKG